MSLQADYGSFTDLADPNNQEAQMDRVLNVTFRMQPVKDEEESAKAGRPIFKPVEFVRIIAPGDRDMVDRPVWDGDRRRFAARYAKFKECGENATVGTPLSAWPTISAAQIEELKFFSVHTVEQLADMPDGNAQKIGPLSDLRAKARLFLEAAKSNAPMERLQSELKKRDAEAENMRERMKQMEAALAQRNSDPEGLRERVKQLEGILAKREK